MPGLDETAFVFAFACIVAVGVATDGLAGVFVRGVPWCAEAVRAFGDNTFVCGRKIIMMS